MKKKPKKTIENILIQFVSRLQDCKGSCILVSMLLALTKKELKKVILEEHKQKCKCRTFSAGASKESPTDPNAKNPFVERPPEQAKE